MQVGQTTIRMNRSGGELVLSWWRQVLLMWTFSSSICVAQSAPSTRSDPQCSMRVNRASDAATERPERDGHQKPSSSYNMLLSAACTPISTTRGTPELPRAKSHLIIDSQLSKAAYRLDEVNQPVDDQDGSNSGQAATPERSAPLSPQIHPTNELYLPLKTEESPGDINFGRNGDLLALSFRDAALREVLGGLAESQGLNLICSSGADTKITGNFHSITFEDAMNTVVSVSGHTWTQSSNVIIVTSDSGDYVTSHDVNEQRQKSDRRGQANRRGSSGKRKTN